MKIAITNTVALNGGDAAILKALIRCLRSAFGKDISIAVFDSHASTSKVYYPEIDFLPTLHSTLRGRRRFTARRRKWLSSVAYHVDGWRVALALLLLRWRFDAIARLILTHDEYASVVHIRDATMVVATGGTYLVEHYPLDARLFDFEVAQYFSRPLVLFTQSLGPFRHRGDVQRLRRIFDYASVILLRDSQSKQHLAETSSAAAARSITLADAAFMLADPAAIDDRLGSSWKPREPLSVAISVRDWKWFLHASPESGMQSYSHAIAGICDYLVREYRATITFISTCQGISSYLHDDSRVAELICEQLAGDTRSQVTIDKDFHTSTELLEKLRTFDLVIATRMHMAILSLCVGTPVLPIAYEFKTQQLFERLGTGSLVCNIDNVTSDILIESLERLTHMLATRSHEFATAILKERQSSLQACDAIRSAEHAT